MNSWFNTLYDIANNLAVSESFQVETLTVKLAAQDAGMVSWVARYLYPLMQKKDDSPHASYYINCIYSDELSSQIIRDVLASQNKKAITEGKRAGFTLHPENYPLVQLCVFAEEGVVWVADRKHMTLYLVYSSRTLWPSLEFSRLTRYLLNQYLSLNGWFLLHAGAVKTSAGNILIVGESGAGKTTLILALLSAGGQYLANELVFVKPTPQSLDALPFSQPAAIGLGSALQFPALNELLKAPYQLHYPPKRLDTTKLIQCYPEFWPGFADKLQLLPDELAGLFQAEVPARSMEIDFIVVPSVQLKPAAPKAYALASEESSDLVLENMGSTRFAAPWLELGLEATTLRKEEDLIMQIESLPALEFEYHVNETISNYQLFLDEIGQIVNS